MITLQNDILTVKIATYGAELKSIRKDGAEYIWQALPEVWAGSAPLLFPICGGLKNDTYTYGGKTYRLEKHGYARKTEFALESAADTEAVFLHTTNEQTRACYPFDYELRVIYRLEGSSLSVTYRVDNKTDGEMYFSIGAHEGYYTPEGIEDYDVIFEKEESLEHTLLGGNLLMNQTVPMLKDARVFPLYEKYFTIDALNFCGIKSRSVTLRNRKNGKSVRVDFPFAPNLLLWHKPSSPYICIEPWAGLPDYEDADGELTHKRGILRLEKGETYLGEHTITLLSE